MADDRMTDEQIQAVEEQARGVYQNYMELLKIFCASIDDGCYADGSGLSVEQRITQGADHVTKIMVNHAAVVKSEIAIDRARDTIPGFDTAWRRVAGLPPLEVVALPTSTSGYMN